MIIILCCAGCNTKPDEEHLKREILEIHNNLIKAHLEKNPDFFIQNLSNNFFSVKNGDIFYPNSDEIKEGMSDYINNTTFYEYKDLQDPIIGFSDDYSTAWIICQLKVSGDRKLEYGTIRKIDFTCAWLTLYKRENDRWITLTEVSTFK